MMDMELANRVAEAPPSVQRFILGALWREVEKLAGADKANDLVRRALTAAQDRRAALRAVGVEVPEHDS